MTFRSTTNMVPFLKPMLSYRMPAMEGPTKAPRANVEVQRPEISPYVSKLLGKPCDLKTFLV
jgi:hypothetical protein